MFMFDGRARRIRSRRGNGERATQGTDGQKRMVKLKVGGDDLTLQIIRFDIELSCRDGSVLVDEESGFVPTPLRRNGTFGEVQSDSTDTVMIRGRVQGRAIRGRLRVKDRLGKSRCDSRWIRFTAQP
jgi:hypothetical protein